MKKLSAKVKRPLWVAGLNIALALTVGSTQAFADTPIINQTQLEAIGTDLAGSYVVTSSFEVVGPISEGNTYVTGTFTGTFDGGEFTISGLTKPLFSVIESTGVISNLSLEADPTFGVSGRGILANDSYGTINSVNTIGNVLSNTNSVGGLVGYSGGSISDSSATGNVTGPSNVGGLVGVTQGSISGSSSVGNVNGDVAVGGLVGDANGSISNSSASGDVTGNFFVGGLVGNSTSSISGSYAEGDVASTNSVTGGLVGYSTGEISNSYATGAVRGDFDNVGGLVGGNDGDISNSYATGAVNGNYSVGGLVGGNAGEISNSYATGAVTGGDDNIGGLVGLNEVGDISNSYATGAVTGGGGLDDGEGLDDVGGLVGENEGNISNSYATGAVTGVNDDDAVGGLVGHNSGVVSNSYATGAVNGDSDGEIDGLVGENNGTINENSYATGAVNDVPPDVSPLSPNGLLEILNTGSEDSPIFALASNLNNGRPYLISNNPFAEEEESDEKVTVSLRVGFNFLPTQALNALSKSVGFEAAKSDLSKLDLALLDQVKGDKSAPIIGAKLFSYQSLTTSLSVGSLLQLEITFQADKSLQMWVKSSDGQYVLVGDVSLDKDGNAVLPGIEFKKSGQYELIFVNSETKDLTQPELVNKVMGLTVYVN